MCRARELRPDARGNRFSPFFSAARSLCAGRAGVPLEVMGLMLGDYVDDYTVKVVDVFAMPQSGTGAAGRPRGGGPAVC